MYIIPLPNIKNESETGPIVYKFKLMISRTVFVEVGLGGD